MIKGDKRGKRGQVTIFIIVAIIIVAAIGIYFVVQKSSTQGLSKNFEPAYKYYLSCVETRTRAGIALLGQQGGYLYTNELPFEPGSDYSPTSSQLDLNGVGVPYWFYVSGNNIVKQQKPTKENMASELSRYISEGINKCNFEDFNQQGIIVDVYSGSVNVVINENSVDVSMNNPVYFYFENETASLDSHKLSLSSKLGKFYDLASRVFDVENEQTFLEYYGLDVMRLYAPVTGVEVSCAPKVFNDDEMKKGIYDGLEANIPFLKLKGTYYDLSSKDHSYFVVDAGASVSEQVSFSYSRDWPTKIDIYGDRIVEPMGMQAGLGILGFCYVPYHFVYDISFPVLFQVYDEKEFFQVPFVSVIKNSQSRNASLISEGSSVEADLCKFKNQDVRVSTFNLDAQPVKASLRFSCLNGGCAVGSTDISGGQAVVDAKLPQCVNGVLSAYAEGYAPSSYIISTNRETSADILMMKIYNVSVNLGNVQRAIILFSSDGYSSAITYPDSKTVQLIEGEYNITAYVYQNSDLIFPAIKQQQCIDVSAPGLAGVLGQEEQKCFDVNTPEQKIENALIGGGRGQDYFTESQLKSRQKLNINIPLFATPRSLDDLQNNYIEMEDSVLETQFA
jgi:hypothetical protein